MMNSSFLIWGQFLVGCFSFYQSVLLIAQYGVPRDTVRSLGYLLSVALTAVFLTEGLGVFGVFPIFYWSSLYGVLAGALAFSLIGFTYLGVVDRPGQLQRKVMWRLPIIGMLMGSWLNANFMLFVLLAGWAGAVFMLASVAAQQRYVLRLFCAQFVLGLVYYWVLRMDWWPLAIFVSAGWILVFHRFIGAFLVKNLMRELHSPVKESP